MSVLTDALVVAVPVVDLDGTAFLQGGLFLLLVIILNPLLFKPWLAAQARRHHAIDGSLEQAARLRVESEALSTDYDKQLESAQDRAVDVRAAARNEEQSRQDESLAEVRLQVSRDLEQRRKKIADDSETARRELSGRVDQLASDIASKLMGGTA